MTRPRRRRVAPGGEVHQRSIGDKPILRREAIAEGELRLGPKARRALRSGHVEKGDPFAAASLAGLSAMKRTSELLPHCHQVPLTGGRVEVRPTATGARVRVEVQANWATGVEMESLVGASVALLTVWDMVKYLEKDASGGYPTASLGPVRVVEKTKRPLGGRS